jgi:hypothetical protein
VTPAAPNRFCCRTSAAEADTGNPSGTGFTVSDGVAMSNRLVCSSCLHYGPRVLIVAVRTKCRLQYYQSNDSGRSVAKVESICWTPFSSVHGGGVDHGCPLPLAGSGTWWRLCMMPFRQVADEGSNRSLSGFCHRFSRRSARASAWSILSMLWAFERDPPRPEIVRSVCEIAV